MKDIDLDRGLSELYALEEPDDGEVMGQCAFCNDEVPDENLTSTFCGSACETCLQEHIEECEICGVDDYLGNQMDEDVEIYKLKGE